MNYNYLFFKLVTVSIYHDAIDSKELFSVVNMVCVLN